MNTTATPGMPRDLRGGGPAEAGAGKTYPVDPAAVERLKAHMAARETAPARQAETAVPTVSRGKVEPGSKPVSETPVDPAAIYPPEVITAAAEQMSKPPRGRRYSDVLTQEVLAVWHHWYEENGKSLAWIAKHNGLIDIKPSSVSKQLATYREQLAADVEAIQTTPELVEPEPETAVSQPDPEPEPTAVAPFAVQKPENLPAFLDRYYVPQRPRPGDALAALVQLMNDEKLTVRGSVKLNLEIEFG